MEITLKNEEEYENALEKVESMMCKDLSEEQLEYFEWLDQEYQVWIKRGTCFRTGSGQLEQSD